MTLETLNKYRWIRTNIEAVREEIKDLSFPVRSPNGREVIGSSGGSPSNPTELNAFRIMELKEKLEKRENELLTLSDEIEEWLLAVEDAELESIVRWHFILSMSWKATSIRVYGYPNPDRARKKVERFLKKTEESVSSASSMC